MLTCPPLTVAVTYAARLPAMTTEACAPSYDTLTVLASTVVSSITISVMLLILNVLSSIVSVCSLVLYVISFSLASKAYITLPCLTFVV